MRAHPRVCGENEPLRKITACSPGSSPRVRGKLAPRGAPVHSARLIPACAGKTQSRGSRSAVHWAHPRVCGENGEGCIMVAFPLGSSPRVRGKPIQAAAGAISAGLIPACAGKTPTGSVAPSVAWAHPRVCGENLEWLEGVTDMPGSSPRVRGKRKPSLAGYGSLGLIPACAGKTIDADSTLPESKAHPRVCGENSRHACVTHHLTGSSPRVRGKRLRIH